jgi:hypothetical protein
MEQGERLGPAGQEPEGERVPPRIRADDAVGEVGFHPRLDLAQDLGGRPRHRGVRVVLQRRQEVDVLGEGDGSEQALPEARRVALEPVALAGAPQGAGAVGRVVRRRVRGGVVAHGVSRSQAFAARVRVRQARGSAKADLRPVLPGEAQ